MITPDQADVLLWLEVAGAAFGTSVDLGDAASDVVARSSCDHDSRHGTAVVCTPDGYLCVACGVGWIAARSGEHVSPEVLRLPASEARAA